MPIYQPSTLRAFLDEWGISPRKGLSQNFLIDGNIVRKSMALANVSANDVILEIGPGPGALTEALLESGAFVIAVEKDPVLASALQRLTGSQGRLDIFCDDILTFPLVETLLSRLPEDKKFKGLANLPYHLTTPILTRLVPLHFLFSSLTLMVQEEVARRLIALPGTSDYSSITLFLNFYATVSYGFPVSHHCFYPAPSVDSAVIHLRLHPPPLETHQIESFFQLTRHAFGQRRKMLRTSLKALYPSQQVEAALSQIGQNPLARPELLSLDDFIRLYHLLMK